MQIFCIIDFGFKRPARMSKFAFDNLTFGKSEFLKLFLSFFYFKNCEKLFHSTNSKLPKSKGYRTLSLPIFVLVNALLGWICHVAAQVLSLGRRVGYRHWQI
jgi:hypothetical protein